MRNPYLSLLQTAWKNSGQHKKKFVLVYAMFICANFVVASNPLFYGWFVNQLQKEGSQILDTAWIYVLGFVGLRLLEWAFHGPARVMERQLAFHASKNYLDRLYTRVLHSPMHWHQENHSGATINRLRKAHESLRDFFQSGFIYLYSFGKFLFSFAAMLYFSPLFGAIGVGLGVLTVYIIIKFDKPFIASLQQVNEREHQVSSTLFDSLSNILTVITLRLESRVHMGVMEKLAAVFPPFKRNVTINELKWFTAQMMVALIYAVITIGFIYQHYAPGETFMIGGLIILLGYVNQFTSVFNDIASHYTQIVRYHTEVQNAAIFESSFTASQPQPAVSGLPETWQELSIHNLTFVRKNKSTAIDGLNVKFKRGERIALIGESGSGKSTLLALMRGLHEPTSGNAIADGALPVSFSSIHESVTLFPQEPEIFENTILYNITLGLPFSEAEVWKACHEAQFDEVVKQLPEGLFTYIRERGANLSGGQRQRLALARGILAAQTSDIVLMDEPTSSIDPKTERKIYTSLFSALQHKTVVSSLHRLHLLPAFDYIYILRQGVIADEGTFEQLSRYSLVFKEMVEHQADALNSGDTESVVPMNVAL